MSDLKKRMNEYDPDSEIINVINALFLKSQMYYKGFFADKKFDISPAQWEVLNQLWKQDGMSQAQLAEETVKERPFITRMVDDLEKKTLVYRKQDKEDRRSNKVFLTAKGRTLKFQILPDYFQLQDRLLEGVSEADLKKVRDITGRMIENIERS